MTGSPIPYFFGNDNMLLTLFLLDVLGIAYVFILNGGSILQRIKNLFYYTRNSKPYNNQTHINRFCNMILYMQVVLFYSVLAFAALQYSTGTLYMQNSYMFWGCYMLLFALCVLAKRVVYDVVNNILFTAQQTKEWRDSYFFTIQLSGFLLFPLVLAMLVMPRVAYNVYAVYITITVLMCLLMLIRRCGKIIFPKKNALLDIFLYLCTLEILPMAVLLKAIKELNIFLTIKF